MPDTLHHSRTQQLIKDIEQKDRRFRTAQSVFTIIILLVLVGIITAQYRTLAGVREQLTQAKTIAAAADNKSKEQQTTILRRLDCMTVFFSQRDRTNLTIENIDQCTLNRDGDLQKFFTKDVNGETQTTKTPQPSTEQPSPKVPSTPSQGESAAPTTPVTPPTLPVPQPQSLLDRTRNFIKTLINGVL